MTATNQSRTDVAAIGQIAFDLDVFLIGGVIQGNPYYYLLCYDTVQNQATWLQGGFGSFLTNQMPQGFEVYYYKATKLDPPPYGTYFYGNTPNQWPNNMYSLGFIPFRDPLGTNQSGGLEGQYLVQSDSGDGPLYLSSTKARVDVKCFDPVMYPNTGNLMVGYKYVMASQCPVLNAAGILPETSTYGGLPFGISNVNPQPPNVVFLPVNWYSAADCTTPITDIGLHLCDRYKALVPTYETDAFYINTCAKIDDQRGNINKSDCLITGGYMYYVGDGFPTDTSTGITCAKAWTPGTQFYNMTDTVIANVANVYGECQSSTVSGCTYDDDGNASCQPFKIDTGKCDMDDDECKVNCPNCVTEVCNNYQGCPVVCTSCKPTSETCIPADPPPKTKKVKTWAIIVIIILVALLLFLLFGYIHKSSKYKEVEKDITKRESKQTKK